MGRRWYREHKRDHYYRAAKKEGYRSRASYKLIQINKRFSIISKGNNVVDLGAAPGGWSQVAVDLVGRDGNIVGVDLDHISPISGATFIRGDMRDKEVVAKVLRAVFRIDVVISDMSPDLSGVYSMDQARSFLLAKTALDFSREYLVKGGNMVVKIFEGTDYKRFIDEFETTFKFVKSYNPPASRDASSERYIIGKNRS